MSPSVTMAPPLNKFSVSRLNRKLNLDDQKVLVALPRDVIPERTWAELLQKEDTELMILEMREEIVEQALHIGYERYMERQTAPFTAHCTALALLKLIDWHFYRHDPGEEPSATPACFIPKRVESWTPDVMADPSPKDSWGRQNLEVVEETTVEETLRKWPSSQSIDLPVIEEIPKECKFPGKVLLPGYMEDESYYDTITFDESVSSDLATESELLQKVTNYTPAEASLKDSTTISTSQKETSSGTSQVQSSMQGGGDSIHGVSHSQHIRSQQSVKRSLYGVKSRSRASLPPLTSDSRSKLSIISDCRLRSLRIETQYEISSEKLDSPPKVNFKRK